MKKKILIAAAVLLVCAVACCVLYRPLRFRLYPGDRITGTVTVTLNGQPYALFEEDVSGCDRTAIGDDGTALLAFHGGDYGDYTFYVVLPADASPLAVHCFQHNWWSVTDFDLQISISTKDETITCSGSCTTLGDNGSKQTDPIDQTLRMDAPPELLLGL